MQAVEAAPQAQKCIDWPDFSSQTNWSVPFVVFCLHLALLGSMTFFHVHVREKKEVKKLIVRTVSLQPQQKRPKVMPKPAALPVAPPPASVIEEALPPPAQEEPAPSPAPAAEPEIASEPIHESVVEEAPPKPAPKAVSKPVSKPVPKPSAKPKPAPKPTPKPKPQAKKEVKKPPVQNKEALKQKEMAKQKEAARQKEQAKKQQEARKLEEARQKEQARQKELERKQNAMVSQALASLDKASKADAKKSGIQGSSGKFTSSAPTAISSLASESLVSIEGGQESDFTPQERTYYDELVSRLKLSLKLPEYGQVKLSLCINRAGSVVRVTDVKCKSSKNRDYIQKTLPKVHFPPFGQNFSGEKDHTFRLTLTNELSY